MIQTHSSFDSNTTDTTRTISNNNGNWSQQTLVTHSPKISLNKHNFPLVEPVYHSTKYSFNKLSELKAVINHSENGFFYSRIKNPTVDQLEQLLAQLQKKEDCIALSTGLAAISTCLLSILRQNDHMIMFMESYRPTRILVKEILSKFGVHFTILSLSELEKLEQFITPQTKLILFESPTNPMTFIPDIEFITQVAKKNHILTILDNTFAGLHQHQLDQIDIIVHSLTKFASGHGDVMGGAIMGSKQIISQIRNDAIQLGPTLDPGAAGQIIKGLKTYFLRYEKQSQNAFIVAKEFQSHPYIKSLYYPGLTSHPHHHLFRKQMIDGGAIIAFTLKDPVSGLGSRSNLDLIEKFINSLKLIKLAASLGSTESLIAPAQLLFAGDLTIEEQKMVKIESNTLRLSVGIENVQDILQDFHQALVAMTKELPGPVMSAT